MSSESTLRLVVGDPHFKKDNSEETALLIREVDRIIEEYKVDEVVLLGDVIDRYSLRTDCRAKRWVMNLVHRVERVILIVGNHEREDNTDYQSDIHYYVGMEAIPNLHIVDKARMIGSSLYVPYVANGRFGEAIAPFDLGKVEWIFAHQSFVGCGEPHAIDKWERESPRVISGHIHTRMYLDHEVESDESKWNIYYPGAALCNNFGDEHERYVCLVDGDRVIDIQLKSIARRLVILDDKVEDRAVEEIRRADRYTRIVLEGTFEDCAIMQQSDLIRDAVRNGAEVKTQARSRDTAPLSVTFDVNSKSFSKRVLEKLEGKYSEEELLYIDGLLGTSP